MSSLPRQTHGRRHWLQASGSALLATALGCRPSKAPVPAAPTLLILGGTSFLGPELVEAARARGFVVTLFNRGKTRPELFPDLEKLRGDRDGDLRALEGRRWDAVIDTSGYVPRIVRASAELLGPSVGHYMFISTISVYRDFAQVGMAENGALAELDDPATEDVPTHYGALKAACERVAESAMPGRVTRLRPGLIVGPDDPTDRFTYWPARLWRGGEVLAPGDPTDPVQFIDVRDLADFAIRVIEGKNFGIYNCVGPAGGLPIGDLLERCRKVGDSDARLTWVDADFLAAHAIEAWSDLPLWLPPTGEMAGAGRIDASRAIQAGLTFRPAETTVRDTLAWWRTLPEERRAKPRAGLSPARELDALALWAARGVGQPA